MGQRGCWQPQGCPLLLVAQSHLARWYMGAQAQVIWYYMVPSGGLRGTCMPGGGPMWWGEDVGLGEYSFRFEGPDFWRCHRSTPSFAFQNSYWGAEFSA